MPCAIPTVATCGKTRRGFRALFTHLLEDHAPLVIHCTAGKDRTGFACALVLHALGVPDDQIAQDYLLTNRFYRRDPSSVSDLPEAVTQVLTSVESSFLAASFDVISADYGDLESYFRGRTRRWSARARRAGSQLSGALMPTSRRAETGRTASGRCLHFGVKVRDNVLESRDGLLNRCDLHQLPAADRAAAVLQRDNQIPPLLLKLNQG